MGFYVQMKTFLKKVKTFFSDTDYYYDKKETQIGFLCVFSII